MSFPLAKDNLFCVPMASTRKPSAHKAEIEAQKRSSSNSNTKSAKAEIFEPTQLQRSVTNPAAVGIPENKRLPESFKKRSSDPAVCKPDFSSLSTVLEHVDSLTIDEKKTSGFGSVKTSSASAKMSDGTSSLGKTSGSAKLSGRLDFMESGKSSICRGSTSSDVSDESSCSSFSSTVNKPHKANDLRWEAIQAVRVRDGVLGLSHFRLLKRLGCGDIGSVYLSELSGTKCYFAMKVMDKTSLASRKKLLRAQTEREILQSLDHPFLPTLYTHFETEKFSCLVMEFCPGGDLHTLRQRQPGKHFSEQAVK